MYANTYMWIYTCMPECMREGTDQMDSVWQWTCKMTTEMLTVAVITAHGHECKTVRLHLQFRRMGMVIKNG